MSLRRSSFVSLFSWLVLGAVMTGTPGCVRQRGSGSRPQIYGGTAVDMNLPEGYATVGLRLGGGLCSATIIHSRLLISARHCFDRGDQGKVILEGKDNPRIGPGPSIARVERYPNGDLALVVLESDITAPQKRPVPILPSSIEVPPGSPVVEAGFGLNEHGETGYLRRVEVHSLPVRNGFIGLRSVNGHGSCKGDSGGPAYYQHEGKWYLIGATSRPNAPSSNCGDEIVLYAFVPAALSWIQEKAQALGISLGEGTAPIPPAPTATPEQPGPLFPPPNAAPIPETGLARALQETYLKRSPRQSSDLAPEAKCRVSPGVTLSYTSAARVEGDHLWFEVRQVLGGCESFTGPAFIYQPHFEFWKVN